MTVQTSSLVKASREQAKGSRAPDARLLLDRIGPEVAQDLAVVSASSSPGTKGPLGKGQLGADTAVGVSSTRQLTPPSLWAPVGGLKK